MTAVGLRNRPICGSGQVVFSLALATLGYVPLLASFCLPDGYRHDSRLNWKRSDRAPRAYPKPLCLVGGGRTALIVLSTAYVLKEQVLDTIEQRHADERAFQCALVAWQAATANPENHPSGRSFMRMHCVMP